MKVAFLNNIPSPYRSILFSKIYDVFTAGNDECSVYYLSSSESVRSWDNTKLEKYEAIFPVVYQKRNKFTTTSDYIINKSFLKKILKQDVVVFFGYNYTTYLISSLIRRFFKKKNILFCESTIIDASSSNIKKIIKKIILNYCFNSYIVPGESSFKYLKEFNVKGGIYFAHNSSNLKPKKKIEIFKSEKIKLLYVGRMSEEKNISLVIDALIKSDLDFRATFVGDGPLLNRFREVTKDDIRFYFTGHLDSSELESVYLENEILVLPSFSEPWGLVVNEAINFGLAVLVSENVGCHPELVQKNGEVFSPYSEDSFLNALIRIINNLDMHRRESLFLAEKYTFLNQAKQFVEAVQGD